MKQRTRWLILGMTLTAMYGCASVGKFDSSETSIAPDAYVVALSVNTGIQGGTEPREGSRYFGAEALSIGDGPVVLLSGMHIGLNLMMFEVPGPGFDLDGLVLAWPSAEDQVDLYSTVASGPRVQLKPGEITYLGSLQITATDIQDDIPAGVGLEFVDAWQQNASAWEEFYPVVATHAPVIRVADSWNGPGLVALETAKESSCTGKCRRSAIDFRRPRSTTQGQSRIQQSGGQP